ncbi:MAG: hypothetical protein GYA51_14835 [Candidatus Methanofastidiosa archaeon]|nr:hypothetical protein [Candidatus Methanofastidiosa archaeon]
MVIEKNTPLSKLSPITKASIILIVLLGAIFLKERLNLTKKLIAAVVLSIGAILVG